MLTCVLVIAVALNQHDGIAFLAYAITSLALVIALQVIGNRKQAA